MEQQSLRECAELREMNEQYGKVVPYWDPILQGHRSTYLGLLRMLEERGLLCFCRVPKCRASIFFVWKKNKRDMRMIVDARAANRRFHSPPHVSLLSAEGFSRMEVEVPSGLSAQEQQQYLDEFKVTFATADVMSCFHRMLIPEWLSAYFAFDPVTASELNLDGRLIGGHVTYGDDVLFPCPRALPMGWAWSIHFCQRANTRSMHLSLPSLRATMTDASSPEVLRQGSTIAFVYVDNLGLGNTDESAVSCEIEQVTSGFNHRGLKIHEVEIVSPESGPAEALGVALDGHHLLSRPTQKRLWKVRDGIDAFLRRRAVTGRALEILLGHITFLSL
eukprot:1779739-Amphidinium_carterae.1